MSQDEPRDQAMDEPTSSNKLALPLWILVVFAMLYGLYFGRTLIVPIITSLFVYLTLRPWTRRLQKRSIPPAITAAALLFLVFGGVTLIGLTVAEPAQQWIRKAPQSLEVLQEKLRPVTEKLAQFDRATEELSTAATDESALEPIAVEVQQPNWSSRWTVLNGTTSVIAFIALVCVLTFFLLASGGDQLLNRILHSAPNFSARRQIVEVVDSVQQGLGIYLGQVTVINIGLGVCVAIGMWILGMPSPVLWGVMATVFNFVPFLGALAGAAIIFLTAAIQFDTIGYAFLVTIVFVLMTSIEGQFVTPWLLGRSMELNPLLVLLSLTFWGWMWGFIGVLLAVPILIAGRFISEQLSAPASPSTVEAEPEPSRIILPGSPLSDLGMRVPEGTGEAAV